MREWMKPAREAAKAICKQRYLEFGCQGQGGKVKGATLVDMAGKYARRAGTNRPVVPAPRCIALEVQPLRRLYKAGWCSDRLPVTDCLSLKRHLNGSGS